MNIKQAGYFCAPLVLLIFVTWLITDNYQAMPSIRTVYTRSSQKEAPQHDNVTVNGDDTFLLVNGTEIYIRSAFYDQRISKRPVIRMWAITPWRKATIHCHVKYENRSRPDVTVEANVMLQQVYTPPHCKWFTATIECLVIGKANPSYVAISKSKIPDLNMTWYKVAIRSYTAPATPKYGICLGTLFDVTENEVHRIVEWFEVQKLLGVHNVILYGVDNVSLPVLKVLKHYEDTGYLIFHPWKLPVPSLTKNIYKQKVLSKEVKETMSKKSKVKCVTYYAQHLSYMDCLYRYVDNFTYLAYIDMDEYIVPSKTYDWNRMFKQLSSRKHSKSIASYYFPEAGFDSTVKRSNFVKGQNMTLYLSTKEVMRMPQFRTADMDGGHVKSIIKPSKVIHAYIHEIQAALPEMIDKSQVHPSIARLNHYRHPAGYYKPTRSSVMDLVMSRYHQDLVKNMETTLEDISRKSY